MNVLNFISEIGISNLLDITFMTILVYFFLIWFKQTRAASVLIGIIIVAIIYLFTRQFNMIMAYTIFEKFFTVIFLALIIIFQEELRHIFEKIASLRIAQNIFQRHASQPLLPEVETLVLTLTDLAKSKIGALIVLKGNDSLERHLDGGILLDAHLNEPILKSIFDPHSVGHDGAVILKGNQINKFMSHLPLSKNTEILGHKGTRHAAALGLSELCDALCLVVSEEKGTIAIARHGTLAIISESVKLTNIIDAFYRETHPKKSVTAWQDIFKKNIPEKVIAVLLSLVIWFVLVQGSKNIYSNVPVQIIYPHLPETWSMTPITPDAINITLSGPRRFFYFLPKNKITLKLEPKLLIGPQTLHITPSSLRFPKELSLEDIDPTSVSFELQKTLQGEQTK